MNAWTRLLLLVIALHGRTLLHRLLDGRTLLSRLLDRRTLKRMALLVPLLVCAALIRLERTRLEAALRTLERRDTLV